MNTAPPVPCELLPWDTHFFGCRIARVCGHSLTAGQAAQIEDWCRQNRIRALYFLSRSDDPLTIQLAEQHDFGLVDVRVTFEQPLNTGEPFGCPPAGDVRLRPVQPDDLSPRDQAVGYVSCHYNGTSHAAQIGLVGVDSAARGQGVGSTLVRAAGQWCRNQGARELTVVTQGKNRAAQRLYQRCGFLTQDLQFWYHKWFPAAK
jgi:dTDP-4-amino-4,6-dideoxy-D-galactose acyltransferase